MVVYSCGNALPTYSVQSRSLFPFTKMCYARVFEVPRRGAKVRAADPSDRPKGPSNRVTLLDRFSSLASALVKSE